MTMSDRPPRGFTEETNATPLVNLTGDVGGPKRPCLVVIAGAHLGEIFPIDGEIIIGRDADATLRLAEDEGVSRRHARVTPVADGALLADLGSQNGTYVDGERVQERVLKEGVKIRVGQTTVLKFARYDAIEEKAQRQLLESALRDGLTRAFNRRYFLQRLAAEIRFAERHTQPLTLLMLDIDHFKQLNDQHGHMAGDEVLRTIPGIAVKRIETSCCGMAGSFGYEAEHYDASLKMAELVLLPAVRGAGDALLVADGTSCRAQIAHGSGRGAMHVARVLESALS